jgi:hypothetical protein
MNIEMEAVGNKIEKLLALSNSPNEAEAESALAKAHELLIKYNLSLDDIKSDKSEVEDVTFMDGGRCRNWKLQIASHVSKLNFCFFYRNIYRKMGDRRMTQEFKLQIVGKKHNIEATKNMINYLYGTIDRMSKRLEGKEEIASYKEGITETICARIKKMYYADFSDTSNCKALVVQEDADIKKYMQENLKLHLSNHTAKISGKSGYYKGLADGKNVSLNKQMEQGTVSGFIA